MTIFTAELIDLNDKRAAELTLWRGWRSDHKQRVTLVETARLPGRDRLPFTWHFENDTRARPYPLLHVVAAPGVSVLDTDHLLEPVAGGGPILRVIRVQDPDVIDVLASAQPTANLVGSHEAATPAATIADLIGSEAGVDQVVLWPWSYLKVDRRPNGISFKHPATGIQLTVEVPSALGFVPPEGLATARVIRDDVVRFAYEIDPEAVRDDPNKPLLKIVATRGVTLARTDRYFELELRLFRLGPELPRFWKAWSVATFGDVPAQGTPITPADGWTEWRTVLRVASARETIAKAGLDILVGVTPVVGDLVDIAEFIFGLATGEDRWGRPLDPSDLAILALAAVMPFVTSGVLRGGRTFVRQFGDQADEVAGVLGRIDAAKLSNEQRELVRRAAEAIAAGRPVDDASLLALAEIMKKIEAPPLTLEALINADNTGFTRADLQEFYANYRGRQLADKKQPAAPADWARSVTTGRPREVLEGLLGSGYARRAPGTASRPPVVIADVPRPGTYANDALDADIASLLARPDQLWERLGVLRSPGAEPLVGSISAGLFRILKGNVAEILSLPLQLKRLASLQARFPKARLVSGVRIRVMEGRKLSGLRLFSDNLIVVQGPSGIRVLEVVEVKSGYRGGQEATEQVFEWVERRLTDESQLILPKGARIIDVDGTATVLERELVYTWKPAAGSSAPEVVGLAGSGNRTLIGAQGASHLGIDSASRAAGGVSRETLERSSAELDYLAARILGQGAGPSIVPVVKAPSAVPSVK